MMCYTFSFNNLNLGFIPCLTHPLKKKKKKKKLAKNKKKIKKKKTKNPSPKKKKKKKKRGQKCFSFVLSAFNLL